jgi:predicted transcriptional regulator
MSYMSSANEHFIQEELAAGTYSDREQLIDEAVDLLRRRRELKRMIAEGVAELDRGEGIPEEEVFAELEAMADEIVREAQEKQ